MAGPAGEGTGQASTTARASSPASSNSGSRSHAVPAAASANARTSACRWVRRSRSPDGILEGAMSARMPLQWGTHNPAPAGSRVVAERDRRGLLRGYQTKNHAIRHTWTLELPARLPSQFQKGRSSHVDNHHAGRVFRLRRNTLSTFHKNRFATCFV